MAQVATPRKLWEHPTPEQTHMGRFKCAVEHANGLGLPTFQDLYDYSVTNPSHFWAFVLHFSPLIYEGTYTTVFDPEIRMDKIPTWFAGLRLNFAENMLLCPNGGKEDNKVAITEVTEAGLSSIRHWTWEQLRKRTGQLAQAMKAHGVTTGDRIVAVSGNHIDTLTVFLATAALGGIFSSSSTDMGLGGILDRLQQVEPRWVFMDESSLYNGKVVDLRDKIVGVMEGMKEVKNFRGVVTMPRKGCGPAEMGNVPKIIPLSAFVDDVGDDLEFTRIPFDAPFLIAYSSGTTGPPKCIVHSIGGVLLNSYKEGQLHQETDHRSVILQYTTTSWIMYMAQVQNLMFGSRLVLFDGSPFLPSVTVLLELAARERVTHMGISPRYLQELKKTGVKPKDITDLGALQIVTSTGMVLADNLFEWFYDQGFPPHVRLNNISGGTDIAGCFGIGNSLIPVYVGGCAALSLGLKVEVYDSGIEGIQVEGRPVEHGVPGELVATSAFPNQPVMFWGPSGSRKYQNAYFARFDNVWTHGDFVMIHPKTGQLLFLGRSDGVLNPSGVRFGSAEIYKVIESRFSNEVADSICVGQRRPTDDDEKVVLFLLMRPGHGFSQALVGGIKSAIRKELSARHVPAYIFPTPEIPTTINMKKVELPVKQILCGNKVKPSGTLLNPESLDYYYQFAEVEKLRRVQSRL